MNENDKIKAMIDEALQDVEDRMTVPLSYIFILPHWMISVIFFIKKVRLKLWKLLKKQKT